MVGKSIRMQRIFNRNTKRTIIVPLDHGVTVGPIPGLDDMQKTVSAVADGGANAVVMHKGVVGAGHRDNGSDLGLIVHLSASTNLSAHPNSKTLVSTVEEALKLGADGVSVQVNLGDENERYMLSDLGAVANIADTWGVPLLAMVYGRGPKISDEYAPNLIAHCARVGMELGADMVKVHYTGDPESFAKIVASTSVPIVIAGGPKQDSLTNFLQNVYDSLQAGGSGLSVGRNIFQDTNPTQLIQALRGLVHEGWTVDKTLDFLEIV